jgi:hypothetical protein
VLASCPALRPVPEETLTYRSICTTPSFVIASENLPQVETREGREGQLLKLENVRKHKRNSGYLKGSIVLTTPLSAVVLRLMARKLRVEFGGAISHVLLDAGQCDRQPVVLRFV